MQDGGTELDLLSHAVENLPFASFEGRPIPEVQFDLATERAIVVEFGPAAAGGFVHLVISLPSEVNAFTDVTTIKAAGNSPENELTGAPGIEPNIGGLHQIEVIRIP
jgi:hypothetical protein